MEDNWQNVEKINFFPSFFLPFSVSNISSRNSFKMFHFHEFSKYNNTKFVANNAKLAPCSILSTYNGKVSTYLITFLTICELTS